MEALPRSSGRESEARFLPFRVKPPLRPRVVPVGKPTAMTRSDELFHRILEGHADANIPFLGVRSLLLRLGFVERIRGSHHFFHRPGMPGILNLQRRGHEAKPYQVPQVRRFFLRQGIGREE